MDSVSLSKYFWTRPYVRVSKAAVKPVGCDEGRQKCPWCHLSWLLLCFQTPWRSSTRHMDPRWVNARAHVRPRKNTAPRLVPEQIPERNFILSSKTCQKTFLPDLSRRSGLEDRPAGGVCVCNKRKKDRWNRLIFSIRSGNNLRSRVDAIFYQENNLQPGRRVSRV